MTQERRFPVLAHKRHPRDAFGDYAGTSIPWALVEPWRRQAMRNHGQTLERLAERGGLHPIEMYNCAHGIDYGYRPADDVVKAWFVALLASVTNAHGAGGKG